MSRACSHAANRKPVNYRLQSAVAAWLDFDADGFAVLSCQISGGRSRWRERLNAGIVHAGMIEIRKTIGNALEVDEMSDSLVRRHRSKFCDVLGRTTETGAFEQVCSP